MATSLEVLVVDLEVVEGAEGGVRARARERSELSVSHLSGTRIKPRGSSGSKPVYHVRFQLHVSSLTSLALHLTFMSFHVVVFFRLQAGRWQWR